MKYLECLLVFAACTAIADGFFSCSNINFQLSTHKYASSCFPSLLRMDALQGDTYEIKMPALSSTMTQGKVVQWLKEVGDEIQSGDAVMVVESDKADMDVECFESGYLASILTPEGETVQVGSVVAIVAEKEEDLTAIASGGSPSRPTTTVKSDDAIATVSSSETGKPTDVEFSEVLMPALSSTMTQGKIVQWLKSVGDQVSPGDALMVVESDKADMDYEVFEDGYLAKIIVDEGSSIPVGSACAIIVKSAADIEKVAGFSFSPVPPKPALNIQNEQADASKTQYQQQKTDTSSERIVASGRAKKLAAEMGIDLSTIKGSGPNGRIVSEDILSAKGTTSAQKSVVEFDTKAKWKSAPGVINATPSARALAKSKKIDLSTIKGTGNFDRVTEADVKLALGITESKHIADSPVPTTVSSPATRDIPELPNGPKAMDGMQKAVAKNMEAGINIPVFRVSRKIRTDNFDDLYRQLKSKGVTVSALLAKAAALAIEAHPIINAAYAPGQIVYKSDINIAMAVAIDGGLLTPTLKKANKISLLELSSQWKQLVGKAKSKSLAPDEYNSGTFYISNLGMFGVSDFGALLPVGVGSILAIGGALPTVVQKADGSFGVMKEMVVTITCDHRHIYGADAAEFLGTFADILENNCASLLL